MRRGGLAITVVVLGSIATVAGLLALGTIQLRQEVDAVGQAVTQRIDEVDPNSQLGEFLVEARVAERIDEHLDRLPTQILIGSPDPADGARLGLEALLVIVLTLYALVNGSRLLKPVFGGNRPARWAGYVRDGVAAAAGQVRRLLAIVVDQRARRTRDRLSVRTPRRQRARHLARGVGGRADRRVGDRIRTDGRGGIARRMAAGGGDRRCRRGWSRCASWYADHHVVAAPRRVGRRAAPVHSDWRSRSWSAFSSAG